MEDHLPDTLRAGARKRRPLTQPGYRELVDASLEERQARRLAELDRATGRALLPVPAPPEGGPPPRWTKPLPPDPAATGGTVKVVRGAWVAKYNPLRAQREKQLPRSQRSVDYSDVFTDYSWGDPSRALGEAWINSGLMRGAPAGIASMDIGDLVFAQRTAWKPSDSGWLQRRTLVGVWFVDSTVAWPGVDANGRPHWYSEANCFPLRRFDFPVPVDATSDIDRAFDKVAAFHDRTQLSLIELTAAEALAVVRACGLPATMLTEPDPNRLAPLLIGLDLGPPTTVRRRILAGAKAAAHRSSVEKAAVDMIVGELRKSRWGVVSTQEKRGFGYDLWAKCREENGRSRNIHIEVKGLSGSNWWDAGLTKNEVKAARRDNGRGLWRLAIVTRALRPDRKEHWLTSREAVRVFTIQHKDGNYTADRAVAGAL